MSSDYFKLLELTEAIRMSSFNAKLLFVSSECPVFSQNKHLLQLPWNLAGVLIIIMHSHPHGIH